MKARDAIDRDLAQLQRERRRHFGPALAIAVLGIGGVLVLQGARADLLDQPPWQLGVQIGLWVLCLIAFPAIGLGLVFPRPAVRIALAATGLALAVTATMGWPISARDGTPHAHLVGCSIWIVAYGAGLLVLGAFAGAFIQRRDRSGVFWIAAGTSLAALEAVTWHCPATGATHVMPYHLGAAALLMLGACVAGLVAHRRR
jgi:hypothetical protein